MGLMSKSTASYLAGFIDGEGYISLKKDKVNEKLYFIPILKVANTNKEIIEWVKNSFGGWIYFREAHGNNKEAYCWQLTGTKLKPFLLYIFPYLRIKKKQCELVLKKIKIQETRIDNLPYKNISRINVQRTQKMIKNFEYRSDVRCKILEIYQELLSLNKRGKNIVQPERLNEKTPNGDAIV